MVSTIVFYISGHGFGHASRDIQLIKTLARRRPDARFLIRTAAPRWLFDLAAHACVDVQPLEADTGVVQIDSLRLDEDETARRAAVFYADFDRRATEEAAFLRAQAASLVIGDIPPLAFAAAERAGVPSVALGNFTWDWIYAAYPSFERLAPRVLQTIRSANALATRSLRLPLHGGFETMASTLRDIPFIARQSARDPRQTRELLGLPSDRPVVLASFGGYGLRLPLDEVARSGRFFVVSTDRMIPEGEDASLPNLVRFGDREVFARGLRYEDLVAAVDLVVSKPGYGIVSECIANNTAFLYTSRGPFPEYDVFVAQMPRLLRCRYISQADLLAGRWEDAVDALLGQPPAGAHPLINGADIAADDLLNLVMG